MSSLPSTETPSGPIRPAVVMARPATQANEEPDQLVVARVRLEMPTEITPSRLNLTYVVDASASMHQFQLSPDERAIWQQKAELRSEVSRQQADGRSGWVWTGQTLRDLQNNVSTPMLSTLRGIWKSNSRLGPQDSQRVLAFGDQFAVIYEDQGNADAAGRSENLKQALTRLGGGMDASGLGRGTRLAETLQWLVHRVTSGGNDSGAQRVVLISDGIVADTEACQPLLSLAVDFGIVISVIGVGDEFDEEFLMRIADLTRGNYYYAPTPPELEQALVRELEIATQCVARQSILRITPRQGSIVRDLYSISPAVGEFQTVWVDGGAWRFRIGDLSALQETEFLVELAAPSLSAGEHEIATVTVEGLLADQDGGFTASVPVVLFYTDERVLLSATDEEVYEAVRRLDVYRSERRAAIALSEGDAEGATRHLQAATRTLRSMGKTDLADEMEAAADDAASGTRNLGRTKRVKAGTRNLRRTQ